MKTIAAYSPRSSLTGKAIRLKLNAIRKRTNRRARCNLFLRWGSTQVFPNTRSDLELNSLEAVKRTANKLEMLRTLSAAGIPIPEFSVDLGNSESFKDRSGNFYIRSKLGVVRYGNDFSPASDLYFTKPVKFKRREYRVHVFNGKVIGIYEKVPNDSENRPKLFKSDNCKFSRCNPENCRVGQAAQETCIRAVQALGLLFGGCDLVRTKRGEFTICEVNSAPGLNSKMLGRYVDELKTYVRNSPAR